MASPVEPPKRLWSPVAWKASTATIPATVTAMLSRAQRGAARPAADQPQAEQQRHRQPRRDGDERGPAPRRAGRVGQGGDGAGAGGAQGGHERRGQRHRERHGRHLPRRMATVSEGAPGVPSRPAPGLVTSGAASQPIRQPGRRRDQGQGQVLRQEHGRDQLRRAADGLEQPDPPGLLGHPPADQDGDAGRWQAGRGASCWSSGPAARRLHQQARPRPRCSARKSGPGRRAPGECCRTRWPAPVGAGWIGEPQVQDVPQRPTVGGGDGASIALGCPGQPVVGDREPFAGEVEDAAGATSRARCTSSGTAERPR